MATKTSKGNKSKSTASKAGAAKQAPAKAKRLPAWKGPVKRLIGRGGNLAPRGPREGSVSRTAIIETVLATASKPLSVKDVTEAVAPYGVACVRNHVVGALYTHYGVLDRVEGRYFVIGGKAQPRGYRGKSPRAGATVTVKNKIKK